MIQCNAFIGALFANIQFALMFDRQHDHAIARGIESIKCNVTRVAARYHQFAQTLFDNTAYQRVLRQMENGGDRYRSRFPRRSGVCGERKIREPLQFLECRPRLDHERVRCFAGTTCPCGNARF